MWRVVGAQIREEVGTGKVVARPLEVGQAFIPDVFRSDREVSSRAAAEVRNTARHICFVMASLFDWNMILYTTDGLIEPEQKQARARA